MRRSKTPAVMPLSCTVPIEPTVVVLSALVLGWRGTGSEALRYALIWMGILFVLLNLFVDLLYVLIDPRVTIEA